MNYYYKYTKIGYLTIVEENSAITNIFFGKKFPEGNQKPSSVILKAFNEIEEFLDGTRRNFSIKLNPKGTSFQKQVWNALMQIPYGQTRSYKEIAVTIKNSNASRAVGMANNKNPIPIIIPCHRVIGTDGKLVGYAGGLKIKETLLGIEQVGNSLSCNPC